MAQLEKIMSIYYGSNKLPYKDEDRQINYPVLGGNLFIGENNVTTIRFYVDRIGGNEFTWLAVVKLPDGSKVYRQLSQVSQEGYVDFDISSVYTSQQGAIFISLQGYTSQNTNVTIDDDNYVINGDPDILVTGVVKIMVNYAPQILNMGTDISYSQYQEILALLSKKLDLSQAIVFYQDITNISSSEIATSELANGQIVYDETTKWFYTWNTSGETFSRIDLKFVNNLVGSIPKTDCTLNTTIATLISKGYKEKLFLISGTMAFYYFDDTTFYLFDPVDMGWQAVPSSDTSKTIAQAFSGATWYGIETTQNKESTNLDSTSATKYPSSKATANYVKANAIASYTFDSTTYQIKFFNGNGVQVGNTIDLPMESVVVSGSYDSTNKQIILTLQNGSTITIGVSDLVSGLIPTSDIVDNLNSNDSTKVLSAKQGKVLNDNKVDKTNSSNQVYGTNSSGNQTTYEVSSAVRTDIDTIPTRISGSGVVRVGTPQGNWDATTKKYCDDKFFEKANVKSSFSATPSDTNVASEKLVYDKLAEIRNIASGCTTSYLTSVEFTEQDIVDSLQDDVVYRYVNGAWTLLTTEGEFNLWKSINQITLNQDFFASTNEQLVLTTELAYHYAIIYKDDKFYLITANDYDKLFADGDNLFVIGKYLDRFYFSNTLEINNGGSPIINESVITSTTPTQNLNSLVSYKCTNALTSLTISGLTQGQNDNNPTWQIQFVADDNFAVIFASGITWKYGTPTFESGAEYTIIIEKRADNSYYAFLI